MSRFKKDPYATLSARHHALKLLGQMERTETSRAAWYTQPTNQASAEYSLSCPCHHLRKNIIFESDLALRVGQAANKSRLNPSFRAAMAHKYKCSNFGYFCHCSVWIFFNIRLCLMKWERCYYLPSQVRDSDPNILKGCPQSKKGSKAG